MPVHDWSRVEAGLFHDFHHEWISSIKRALNRGLLPKGYYALAEQFAGGVGPDVLALQGWPTLPTPTGSNGASPSGTTGGNVGILPTRLALKPTAETDYSYYRRKQSVIAIRHISGHRVVAVVEIVSLGNKASANPLRAFVKKALEFMELEVHLLILDLYPPGKQDPLGIHGVIWGELTGQPTEPPPKPFTLASYEASDAIRAYVNHAAPGDTLPDVPLFIAPGAPIILPLETTYQRAYEDVPEQVRQLLEPPAE